jgi:eukaryotic-like serine/threonine-protein kinase
MSEIGTDGTRLDPLLGVHLGEYKIESRLGAGGMGVVYRASHPVIGKSAAIKVLQWEYARDPTQMERLVEEARAVNAIRHRGIIDIFGFGKTPDGRQYLIMELLEGEPLDRVISAAAPMSAESTLPILDEIIEVLEAAHGVGVVHRDLKPSNIFLVSPPVGVRYVKVLDFGLAKQAEIPGGSIEQTNAQSVVGTPGYMAPEQALGQPVLPATDLYAVGVIAFEMLTGRLPFNAANAFEIMRMHVRNPAPAPSAIQGDVPPALDEWVLSLLEKDPEVRVNSAAIARLSLMEIRRQLGLPSVRPERTSAKQPRVSGERPKARITAENEKSVTTAPTLAGPGSLSASRGTSFSRHRLRPGTIVAIAALGLGSAAAVWFTMTRLSQPPHLPEAAMTSPAPTRREPAASPAQPVVATPSPTSTPPAANPETASPTKTEMKEAKPRPLAGAPVRANAAVGKQVALRIRLNKIKSAWQGKRSTSSNAEFVDSWLMTLEGQVSKADPEAKKNLDEFVQNALGGVEP